MAHAQPRVAALLHVALRTAEAADQELPQPFLCAVQIVFGIHRPENLVTGHLRVERADQSRKAVFADLLVDLTF